MNATTALSNSGFPTINGVLSEKLRAFHRERLAVVYVRQSTVQQVLEHQESTQLQYGLVNRAQALGWDSSRILVIDDDLGKSGTSAQGRVGFQRLVSEVSLDHVGVIFGIEMSRLARSNKDWHQLLELCALFHTLIADVDGIYDPTLYNDRLLLGLKGTMSEAELHILKQRMYQGRLNKARRGDLQFALPVGYVWSPTGEIQFDSDEQVQQIVRFVFRTFDELGTLGGLVRYLALHHIQLGVRVREGPGKGELVWRRPNRATLQMMLKHPLYAGFYVYGRRQDDPRRKQLQHPRAGRVVVPQEEWFVLLPDRCPASISTEQYERNQQRLYANRARADAMGAARSGAALLAGLVVCARCACRMTVRDAQWWGPPSHLPMCRAAQSLWRTAMSASGRSVPRSLCERAGACCLGASRARIVPHGHRAAGAGAGRTGSAVAASARTSRPTWAERAARQYQAVEPEHRLVARTLERARAREARGATAPGRGVSSLSPPEAPSADREAEREAIRRLATDIPAIWAASTTTDAERKELLRQIIERVVVDVQGTSEQVRVRIEWIGGNQTEGIVIRPIGTMSELSTYPQICHQVQELTEAGWTAVAIAQALNEAGFRPPRSTTGFRAEMISHLQREIGVKAPRPRVRHREGFLPNEWWPAELTRQLQIPRGTLMYWIRQGVVRARQLDEPLHRWVVWADEVEQERLRAYHQRAIGDEFRQRWTQTPLADHS